VDITKQKQSENVDTEVSMGRGCNKNLMLAKISNIEIVTTMKEQDRRLNQMEDDREKDKVIIDKLQDELNDVKNVVTQLQAFCDTFPASKLFTTVTQGRSQKPQLSTQAVNHQPMGSVMAQHSVSGPAVPQSISATVVPLTHGAAYQPQLLQQQQHGISQVPQQQQQHTSNVPQQQQQHTSNVPQQHQQHTSNVLQQHQQHPTPQQQQHTSNVIQQQQQHSSNEPVLLQAHATDYTPSQAQQQHYVNSSVTQQQQLGAAPAAVQQNIKPASPPRDKLQRPTPIAATQQYRGTYANVAMPDGSTTTVIYKQTNNGNQVKQKIEEKIQDVADGRQHAIGNLVSNQYHSHLKNRQQAQPILGQAPPHQNHIAKSQCSSRFIPDATSTITAATANSQRCSAAKGHQLVSREHKC
jgi:hypothetical protein